MLRGVGGTKLRNVSGRRPLAVARAKGSVLSLRRIVVLFSHIWSHRGDVLDHGVVGHVPEWAVSWRLHSSPLMMWW